MRNIRRKSGVKNGKWIMMWENRTRNGLSDEGRLEGRDKN